MPFGGIRWGAPRVTTVAYRDGIIAADSGEIWGDEMRNGAIKVHNTGKYLFGLSGDYKSIRAYLDWIMEIQHDHDTPSTFYRDRDKFFAASSGYVNGLLVNRQGHIWSLEECFATVRNYEFDTLGSGADYATGAMARGASAVEAVQVATEFSGGSMAPVVFTSFDHDVTEYDSPLTVPHEAAKQYTIVG